MLYDLAIAFPTQPHGITHPSAGLPSLLRQTLAQKFGHLGAATDRHPIKSAARVGIEMRPYQLGDKLQALSQRTLLRTDRLESRVEESPGRQHVLMALHTYENMNFKNDAAVANKTQVALACAAIIERLHLNQSHSTTLHCIDSVDFEQQVRKTKSLSRYQAVYLISDFLNRDRVLGFASEAIHEIVAHAKVTLVVVRDPLEWFDKSLYASGALADAAKLEPYMPNEAGLNQTFENTMSEAYRQQLAEQFQLITTQAEGIHAAVLWAHGQKNTADFCAELSDLLRPQHRMALL